MDKLLFREATLSDLDTLLQFEQGVVTAERPFDSTLKSGTIHYYDLEALIQSKDARFVVGHIDSEIICCGYGKKMMAKDFQKIASYIYIGFMYVQPAYRGKGISQKIIDNIKTWADHLDIKEVRLDVYAENESAVKAYEKAGFKQHLITMRFSGSE